MFEIDEMEGCWSCKYEECGMEEEPCKHCYGTSSYVKKVVENENNSGND